MRRGFRHVKMKLTKNVIAVIIILMNLSQANSFMFDIHEKCPIKELCGNFFDMTKMERKQTITFLTPELCHPASSGLMKARPENITVNFDRSCPLVFFDSRYRSVDGTCNNPFNLGSSSKTLSRLLEPRYEDGEEMPRMFTKDGRLLPSPRLVSKIVHPDVRSTTRFTIYLMQWGQLMDHDMISTPLPVEDSRRIIKCCNENKSGIRRDADRECMPITFSEDENFIGNCMEFVRSVPVKDTFGNVIKPRQHLNVVTAFLDLSVVYGSTEDRLRAVRDRNTRYMLKMTKDDYLPDNGLDDCIKKGPKEYCFLAGDERVNEHPGLSLMHLVLARLHNRIAYMLHERRPHYVDEEIFQRTKSILGAVAQKIMYHDWLPIILGKKSMMRNGLAVGPRFHRPEYDSFVDPSIPSSFGAAVFRFGHTLIPRSLPIGGKDILLRDLFFKPSLLKGNVETLASGMASSVNPEARSQAPDAFIVKEVTNHLFEPEEGIRKSFDLVALNLQRARDHGIPPYNDYRELCGLSPIKSFNDPRLGISQRALRAVYRHPDDIDLFTGGIVEPLAYDGLVGETFNCLISKVFHNLKYGDRFFYEMKNQRGSLSDGELSEIRKVTLSQILCQTTRIKMIQLDAFRIPSQKNPEVSCEWLAEQGININVFTYNW